MARRKPKLKRYHLKRFSSEVLNVGTKMKKGQQSYANLIGRTMDSSVDKTKFGATVLYQSRVKDYVHHNIPRTQPQFLMLSRYDGVPNDRVPPIIAVMRRREALTPEYQPNKWDKIAVVNGTQYKLHWFYQGNTAFFMEEDGFLNIIRRSADYPFYKAKVIANRIHEGGEWPIIWIETFDLNRWEEEIVTDD